MTSILTRQLVTSISQTNEFAQQIAGKLSFPACLYLTGQMGVGKTTLSKSLIRALGSTEPVTSPTYTLVQEYTVTQGTVFHMDLYRINDADELEFLALHDLWSANTMFIIEWPEKAQGRLIEATHSIALELVADNPEARSITFCSH